MARKQHHEEHENHERWLVSYADFITLLFAFFVVMYSVSRVDTKKVDQTAKAIQWAMHFQGTGGTGAPPVFEGPPSEGGCAINLGASYRSGPQGQRAVDALRHQLEKKLRPFLQSQKHSVVTVEGENGRLSIRLSASHFFDPGRAAVRPETLPVLDAVAEELSALGRPIRVEGHTDDQNPSSSALAGNWELSTSRAATVTAYLQAAHHIPAERLSAAGFASSRPIASNVTPEGREANRRIELVIELAPKDPLDLPVR